MLAEQRILGLSTGEHVMSYLRAWLKAQGI
jgi:hypothetical protein